jgi:hypothetical protein
MPTKIERRLDEQGDIILRNEERLRFLMDLNGVPKWLRPASFMTLPHELRTHIFIWRGLNQTNVIPLEIQKEPKGILKRMQVPDEAKKWLGTERDSHDIPADVHDDKVVIFMLVFPHTDIQPQYEVAYHAVNIRHLLMTPQRLEEDIAGREYAFSAEKRKPLNSMRFAHMILTGIKSADIPVNLGNPIPLSEIVSPYTHFQSERVIDTTTTANIISPFVR